MKKVTRFFIAGGVGLASFISLNATAQDFHFSQFYNSPLTINPANTGLFNGDMRAIVNYKDQWKSVANSSYKTMAASFDMRLMQKKWKHGYMAYGVSFFSDKAGIAQMSTTQANGSFSVSRDLNVANNIALGVQGGFGQKGIKTDGLTWDDEYQNGTHDPIANPTKEPIANAKPFSVGDVSWGIIWNYGKGSSYATANNTIKARVGYAMFHVNTPNQSYYADATGKKDPLYLKQVIHGNLIWGVKNTPLTVMPGFYIAMQGPSTEKLFGGIVRYTLSENSKYTGNVKESAASLGMYFRTSDAAIIVSELELANYAIGISYDVNVSSLRTASRGLGGLEFSIRYVNPNPFRNKSSARF